MTAVYFGLTAAWVGEMARLRAFVLPVHYLCLACVVVKTLETALVAVYYHGQVCAHERPVAEAARVRLRAGGRGCPLLWRL